MFQMGSGQMAFKNAHIFPPCLCTNWRHWRQWFLKFLSVLLTDLSNFSFHLKISTASLNIPSLSPLRFQNCFRIPFPLAWRSASYVHREAREGEWDGVEKWICIFICIEAPADLRTVRLVSFLAVKPTEWLASLLGGWSDWLIPLTDRLTYYRPGWHGFSSTLTDPRNWALILTECLISSLADVIDSHLVFFFSGWLIQLS